MNSCRNVNKETWKRTSKCSSERKTTMSPMKVSEFRALPKVASSGTKKIGKKVDWSKVEQFLTKNKDNAYTVKEVHEYTLKNACNEGQTISRVRVYKFLNSLVKKNKVEVRFDEQDIGLYNWAHIAVKATA